MRISKATYDRLGGMRNSSLYRVQRKQGGRWRWFYFLADDWQP